MIFVYLIIVAIVAILSYKYILGGREAIQERRDVRFQRKVDTIWRKQFAANMADIEAHWNKDYPKPKRQNIVVKGAMKRFEKAWVE